VKETIVSTQLKDGQTILFIGDSITDCGRRDAHRPLGMGYVKLFADLTIIREPEKRIAILNKGINGERATGLRSRWSDDVLRNKPDWLSIEVGINDLLTYFRHDKEGQVPPALYEEAYRDILERTRATLPKCRILLIDPYYISRCASPNSARKQMLDLLPEYIAVVAKMSKEFKTRRIKAHAMFQRLLADYEPEVLCPEPIHPNPTGHLLIAEAVYDAMS
jgi:lysophospholipase L1-like esterase